VIIVEDLKIKNMMASAAGTVEKPGKNIRQKAGLNRTIGDQAWGKFIAMLRYKMDWRGGLLIEVGAHYTSQRRPKCGFTHALNRESQSRFGCINPECN
jgi:putative transposase